MKIEDYLELDYIQKQLRSNKDELTINFGHLCEQDPDLGSQFINNAEDYFEEIEAYIRQNGYNKTVLVENLFPSYTKLPIKDLREKHIGRLLNIEGTITYSSSVVAKVSAVRYECKSCGNVIKVLQNKNGIVTPKKCRECGAEKSFYFLDDEKIDYQRIIIEESQENVGNNTSPQKIDIILKGPLTKTKISDRVYVGAKVNVYGIIKTANENYSDKETTTKTYYIDAKNIIFFEKNYLEIEITAEEEEQIKEISQKECPVSYLAESFASFIHGCTYEKKAILLQQFGGVWKENARGMIHILLVGDPSTGKTQIAKEVEKINPIFGYAVGGKSSSSVGLVGGVKKDNFTQKFEVDPGILPLKTSGTVVIDEADKISKEDIQDILSQMSSGKVDINKASVRQVLKAQTNILGVSNPKYGNITDMEPILSQITINSVMRTRFDLIFVLRDKRDEETERSIARAIVRKHMTHKKSKQTVSYDLMMKYIVYAKRIIPEIRSDILKYCEDLYVQMRGKDETLSFKARQLEGVIRLSEAHARSRLSNYVEKKDIDFAVSMVSYTLQQTCLDTETGRIDITQFETGINKKSGDQMSNFVGLIRRIKENRDMVPIEELQNKITREMKIDTFKFDSLYQKLKTAGDAYEPKRGFCKLIE